MGPLRLDDRGVIAELREVLRAAGLDGNGVREALGVSSELLTRSQDVPVRERRLAGNEPLGTLIKLFVLDLPVAAEAAEGRCAPLSLAQLEQLGLLEANGGEVRPRVRLVPHDEILIASDRRLDSDSEQPDHVAGVHGPSLTLSHLTVRRPVERALDMGTGSGVQAILASRHSDHVVATDLNERALNFAAFNAVLNGVENVEFRTGSFFEPVADERFNLVTTNPPYVISPESAFLFRDSGLEGDEVSHQVVGATPEHVEEGGFATILASWAHTPGEDWTQPCARGSREAAATPGCCVTAPATRSPTRRTGIASRTPTIPPGSARRSTAGSRTSSGSAIEGVAYGAVILRRRSGGENWICANELPSERLKPAGEHILRVFEAQDYLSGLADDRELLDGTFALAPHDLLEQRVEFRDGGWVLVEVSATLQDGLGLRAGLDPMTVELLTGLDGIRKLRRVVEEQARRSQVDRNVLETDAVGLVRSLLGAGFLTRRA